MTDAATLIMPADPKADYLAHKAEIDLAVQQVMNGGHYILGPEVQAFEQEFAAYVGAGAVVATGSGTDALELALRTCNIGPGDAVFTVSLTAVATVAAIELVGATAVLVDIDPVTFCMQPESLAAAVASCGANQVRPRAIIPVHLYGCAADMPALMQLARQYDLIVIEDCAQAHGAMLNQRKVGSWGDLAAFSFYPTKNLSALGDGGALAVNRPELIQRSRWLREYGWQTRYVSAIAGMNTRLDELQAAILRIKLRALDHANGRRQALATIYTAGLATTGLILPQAPGEREHVYHQYVIRCGAQRDALQAALKQHGIITLIHYPQPVHLQPAYKSRLPLAPGGLPETETACREILSLPMYAQLPEHSAERVSSTICRLHS